jgi:hypothetical protein
VSLASLERFRLVKVSLASLGEVQVRQVISGWFGKDLGETRCLWLAWERFSLDMVSLASLGEV